MRKKWFSIPASSSKPLVSSVKKTRVFEQLEDRRVLANIAPDLAVIADTTGVVGTEIVIQLSATDADGPDEHLYLFFDPDETPVTNAVIDQATRTFRWTPTADQVGSFNFVILVTDRGSPALADAEDFTITIEAAPNLPPVHTLPELQTTLEDTALVFAVASGNAISVADPDAGQNPLQVTLVVENGRISLGSIESLTFIEGTGVDDTEVTFSGTLSAINAALEGLEFMPEADFFGTALLTVTTSDLGNTGTGGELITTDSLEIEVTPVADTPSVTDTVTAEDTQSTDGLVITPNVVDGDEVSHFQISSITHGRVFLSDGVTEVLDGDFITAAQGAAGLRFLPEADFFGNATFRIQAATSGETSGLGGDVITATIEVTPVNDPPLLEPISNKTIARGEELVFTVVGSDVDPDDTLTYTIDPDLEYLGASIDPQTGLFRWTPPVDFPLGPVTVRVIVIDDAVPALADSATFTITVTQANSAPVLQTIGDQEIEQGSTLSFVVQASDPDEGDTLTFALAEGAPSGATIDSESGAFTWTPSAGTEPGEYSITVTVSDNRNPALTDTQTFIVLVQQADLENQTPLLDEIAPQTVELGNLVQFQAIATDPDGDTITYTLDGDAPAGAVLNPVTGEFSWTPTEPGVFEFHIFATDNGNPALSDSRAVIITVLGDNQEPTLHPIENLTVAVGTLVEFTALAYDPDNNALTYTLDARAPEGATIDEANGEFAWIPTEPGVYEFSVIVTDDGLPPLFDEHEVILTVV